MRGIQGHICACLQIKQGLGNRIQCVKKGSMQQNSKQVSCRHTYCYEKEQSYDCEKQDFHRSTLQISKTMVKVWYGSAILFLYLAVYILIFSQDSNYTTDYNDEKYHKLDHLKRMHIFHPKSSVILPRSFTVKISKAFVFNVLYMYFLNI